MSKGQKTKVQFDPSQIKPLDGSPMMSANCWNAVLETVEARAQGGKPLRCLEWGAGNSTVSLVRKGRKLENDFEFVSIEHETNFFHWLAESILAEFFDGSDRKNLKVTWQPMKTSVIPFSKVWETLKAHRALESVSLGWQIILNSRRLQYIERIAPRFSLSFLGTLKQIIRMTLVGAGYAFWLAKSVGHSFISGSKTSSAGVVDAPVLRMEGDAVEKGKFFEHFEKDPTAGCFTIEQNGKRVELWHLPALQTVFWSRGLLLDGSIKQLFDYVCVPLKSGFDVIFIDGRARVSCIKRAHRDSLLKSDGSLFVHDAFRAEMMEGFRLFSGSFTFIQGSNVTLNGQARCVEDFGFPLARVGDTLETTRQVIAQELFAFKNSHETHSS